MKNDLLINRNFSLLWLGKLISQVGDKFYSIALAWWVLQTTHSPAVMGLLMAASVLPGLLIGPLAGALIDRCSRKPFIVAADVIRGLFVIAAAAMSLMNVLEIWHVFVVAVVISLGSAFFDPSVQAVLPQIVPEENLPRANGLSQMVGGVSMVAGPLLGALAVSFFGVTAVFIANGVSYLLSAFCVLMMNIPRTVDSIAGNKETNTWQDIREGLRFLTGQKRILIVMIIIGVAHFFMGSLMVSLPFLARELSGNGVRNLGFLETMMGAGLIGGSVWIALKKNGGIRDFNLFIFMIAIGFCYLSIGILKRIGIVSVLPYMLVMVVIGGGIANASVYWQSILQMRTPNEIAGRVFSISTIIGNVSLPLAFGLFGFVLARSSVVFVMIFSGVCLVVFSYLLMINYPHQNFR